MRLPPTHSFTHSFFGIWKVFRRYISGRRFIYVSFVVPEFSNFKWFRSSRKYHFKLPLGGFLAITPLKCSQILLKFWPVMQCKVMHDIGHGFYCTIKKWSKLGKKTDFLTQFCRFLVSPSYALSFRPQSSAKLKVLWRYIIVVSFISIAFVVAKLWVFKGFRSSKNYHCRLLLGVFLAITPPNAVRFFWNFEQ